MKHVIVSDDGIVPFAIEDRVAKVDKDKRLCGFLYFPKTDISRSQITEHYVRLLIDSGIEVDYLLHNALARLLGENFDAWSTDSALHGYAGDVLN